jgi:hypothetical protein
VLDIGGSCCVTVFLQIIIDAHFVHTSVYSLYIYSISVLLEQNAVRNTNYPLLSRSSDVDSKLHRADIPTEMLE